MVVTGCTVMGLTKKAMYLLGNTSVLKWYGVIRESA